MSRKIILVAILLVMGLLLLPTNINTAVAAPGVSGTVWFFPKYDNVPLYPATGKYATLQLWVTPDAVMGNTTGIQQIDIWVPKDINNLAYYRVVEVQVALYNVTGYYDGQWVFAPPNWTVSLLDVDANNAPRHIQAVANVPSEDALFYNKTNAAGYPDFGYFRAAVFVLTVEWTRLTLTNGLASVDWAVTLSGTDFTSQFHPTITHFVDIEPPTYSLSSSTQSLLAGPCLSSTLFNFTLSITDNSGLAGINYTYYGAYYFDFDSAYNPAPEGEPSNFMYSIGVPSGDPYDAFGNTTWNILENPWSPLYWPLVPDYPFPLPNASTYPGMAFLWGELVVIANDSVANYTQIYPLMSVMGTNTFMAMNPATGGWGVDLSPTGPWVGGLSPSIAEFTVKFYVILFDGTIDYTADQDLSLVFIWHTTNYGGIVTNAEANYLLDQVGTIFYDAFPHPLYGATITGASTGISVTSTVNGSFYGVWSEGAFTLNWSWGTYGPDPTFEYFRVLIYHEDTGTLVVNTTTTDFSVSWDVWDTGIGDYNFTILMTDCSGEHERIYGYLTVVEFVIVKLNGMISKWSNYPTWLHVYQGESVSVDIRTFGRAFNAPYQAVNVTVSAQNTTTYPPGIYYVIVNDSASLVGGTSTYGEWSYLIDVAADLGNLIGIYNVSIVWYNTSTGSVIAADYGNTFIVDPILLLDFWADDSVYTTGETVTFFARVYDLFGNDIDNATVSVMIWDPTNYLIATTAGITMNGYVTPEVYGTITFGVHIGDSWEPGTYTAEASTAWTSFIGNWYNGTTWLNLTSTSAATQTLTFDVSVLRMMDLDSALNDLASSLSDVSATLDSLSADMANVLSKLTSLESSVAAIASDVAGLVSDMSSVLSTLSSMSNTLSTIAGDLSGLISTVNEVLAGVNNIQSTLGSLAGDISGLADQLDDLRSALSEVQGILNNLATKSDVQQLASSLDQVSSELTSTLGSISSLVMATAVLVIITLIVAAVTTFKVFRS